MKKIVSINYSNWQFNLVMLLLRVIFGGVLLLNHGLVKLMKFSLLQDRFHNFMGMGSKFSLILAIFAELFCSLFVILGMFTRFTVVPLILTMLVAIFSADVRKTVFAIRTGDFIFNRFFFHFIMRPGKNKY